MSAALVSEAELRAAVGLEPEALEAIAEGFAKLSLGEVTQPPILRLDLPEHHGELDVKTAYVRGLESFAVKLSTGFFDNPRRGLPTAGGLMIVLSSETGAVRAVLLDNGYLTDLRTALAGALAARLFAPATVRTVGVVGTGAQARWQLRALPLARAFERALVWGRRPQQAEAYAAEMSAALGKPVAVAESLERLVAESELVVTTTPAREPLIRATWLHPGLHLTAMGADAEHKNELEPAVLAAADRIACDSRAQCLRLGELRSAREAGALRDAHEVAELGEVVAGRRPGRQDEAEITICDLTGTGVQDTAIARLALERLQRGGA